MKTAVVVDCVRTPIGRAHPERGIYRNVRGDDLAATCVQSLIQRTGIDAESIEDVLMGCTQQTKEGGLNAGRMIGLMAGAPISSGGATINRLCGSSLQALNQAVHSIMANAEDVHIIGGFEHMQHLPMDHGLDFNPKLFTRTSMAAMHMGYTAEFLAQTMDISREDQDAFALASHQ
jgi:acetyl-CoA acyltransferase